VSKLMLLAVVLLLSGPICQAQSVQDYDAHLARLQKSIPEWRAQIDAVDPAKIEVPYHIGKFIDDSKKVLVQNLDLVSLYSANLPSKRSLSAEIDLYALLREVHSNIDMLSDTLMNMVGDNQKTAQAWAKQLDGIASGPLNVEEQYQIQALDAFANDLEHRCGSHASPIKQ
jgi:hypothetical protein